MTDRGSNPGSRKRFSLLQKRPDQLLVPLSHLVIGNLGYFLWVDDFHKVSVLYYQFIGGCLHVLVGVHLHTPSPLKYLIIRTRLFLLLLVLVHSDFQLTVSSNLCTILGFYVFCVFVIQ